MSVDVVTWHPLGHYLVSISHDGPVKFWCREPPGSSLDNLNSQGVRHPDLIGDGMQTFLGYGPLTTTGIPPVIAQNSAAVAYQQSGISLPNTINSSTNSSNMTNNSTSGGSGSSNNSGSGSYSFSSSSSFTNTSGMNSSGFNSTFNNNYNNHYSNSNYHGHSHGHSSSHGGGHYRQSRSFRFPAG